MVRSGSIREMWELELERGLEDLGRGAFDEAASHFDRAHRAAPDEPTVCYALGRERLRAGSVSEAEELLCRAWSHDRSLLGAAAALARCLGVDQGRFDEAHAVLDEASATTDDAVLDVVRAELLLEQGKLAGARAAAERALEADDSDYVVLAANSAIARADNFEGADLAAGGELDAALFRFRRAAIADPDWAAPHLNAAKVFEKLGRPRAALASADRARVADPIGVDTTVGWSRMMRRFGNGERAVPVLEDAVDVAPADAALVCELAEIRIDRGQPRRATEELAAFLQRFPTEIEAWFVLARAELLQDLIGPAEECLRQVIELDPTHRDALSQLADLLAREGRYIEAAALARRAQALDPGDSI